MRRKSERASTKKAKNSPEKKIEKPKRGRTRRRKQSSSSDNESVEETSTQVSETVIDVDKKLPLTPKKTEASEEAPDQVWHVKATEGSGDVGEIQKLKICLARPPSTPERVDRSPRSKRKHSRATSSSDTPSVEAVEERKKTKHRSKRSTRESKDDSEKNESQEEPDTEDHQSEKNDGEITQSSDTIQDSVSDEVLVSTTNEDAKTQNDLTENSGNKEQSQDEQKENPKNECEQSNSSAADTTVVSPRGESADDHQSQSTEIIVISPNDETAVVSTKVDVENLDKESSVGKETPGQDSESLDKSEVLEIYAEDNKLEVLDHDTVNKETTEKKTTNIAEQKDTSDTEVSKTEDQTTVKVSKKTKSVEQSDNHTINETDVVDGPDDVKADKRRRSIDTKHKDYTRENRKSKEFERSDSTQSTQENVSQNGSSAPFVVSRKRRWGSRPTKLATQKSITISTDVLKEIIPDVKPVEFEEVIEEKKHHKRVEVTEKLERPILPKIVIDNTENMQQHRKEKDRENDEKDISKTREPHVSSNRKISIVKDNNSIIARPPSPPRHKQSCILFITNLVRPFTLPQLKNLLQRTGRIDGNGFWIDKIKSKCFVKYETEDQAVETRHALHGVTWPVSNPKSLQVDFSTQEAFEKAKQNEENDNAQTSTIPGTVEDWLREQDLKRERGELLQEKPWERKAAMREWDVGKGDKEKEKDLKLRKEERPMEKRRHRTPERSPEPARKFKKKEEEAPAKLLDDLFRKTKTTPCIYWLPLSAETIAVKEEQRRQHMAEHERRLQELRRTHRRH